MSTGLGKCTLTFPLTVLRASVHVDLKRCSNALTSLTSLLVFTSETWPLPPPLPPPSSSVRSSPFDVIVTKNFKRILRVVGIESLSGNEIFPSNGSERVSSLFSPNDHRTSIKLSAEISQHLSSYVIASYSTDFSQCSVYA